MKRNTRLDYRCYHVDPPRGERNMWTARALLRGMSDFEGGSEREIREQIDYAYNKRKSNE